MVRRNARRSHHAVVLRPRHGEGHDRRRIASRVTIRASRAAQTCPSIAAKNITPHVLHHTCAMRMLACGIDSTTIALRLGHESPASTNAYLHADLDLKQRALDRTAPLRAQTGRFRPNDRLPPFLEAL